ncbi:hypothetical protein HMPREF9148_01288 [Prevotella sp. F0091]|nr:hypothetical protein HMPREF9148_01288 [Prevotella sp. F0091]
MSYFNAAYIEDGNTFGINSRRYLWVFWNWSDGIILFRLPVDKKIL